jgi:hypothetical protein
MPLPAIIDVATRDLFTSEQELRTKYTDAQVVHVIRLRDMYNWMLSNPDAHDRQFVEQCRSRYQLSRSQSYEDLALIKRLLPALTQASRDFHRWKANEMLLETYRMAKARKDTKTMERAASSYAKYNRVDLEDEQAMPYDKIVIQPFTATSDPSVLGIRLIPHLDEKIAALLRKYGSEDIEDIEYEEADLEEEELFAQPKDEEGE